MNKIIGISLMLFFVLVVSTNAAHSQVEEIPVEELIISTEIELEIPPTMIVGQEYEGHILYKKTSVTGTLVQVRSSNPAAINLSESIFLPPEMNHGTIKIIPEKEGEYKIFVANEGISAEASTTVISPQREPNRIEIVVPINNTMTTSVPGMIFVVDANGAPVKVEKELLVSINTKGGIKTGNEVRIINGTFSTLVDFEVLGTGTIFASANNLNPGEIEIIKEKEEIQIELGIAPDVVLEHSEAFFYVSLTKNGVPFIPNYVLDVTLTSGDSSKGRFTINPPVYASGEPHTTSMREGLARGIIYTGDAGQVTISANIEGIGSIQKTIIVGPAEIGEYNADEIEDTINAQPVQDRFEIQNNLIPNWVKIWTYPNPCSGQCYGVIATYNANFTNNITIEDISNTEVNSESEVIEEEKSIEDDTLIIPMKVDGRSIIISDNGLNHKSPIVMTERNIVTHAVEFEILASEYGEFDITAIGPGLSEDTTKLTVLQESGLDFEIKISPLPVIIGDGINIAYITIVDKDSQSLIDLKKTFGSTPKLNVNTISGKIFDIKTIQTKNGWIVKGDVKDSGVITASITNIGLTTQEIIPGGIAIGMEIWMPKNVHVGEPFPYTIHEVDIFGNVISKVDINSMSAPNGVRQVPEEKSKLIIDTNGPKQITFLGTTGIGTSSTDAFLNYISLYDDLERTITRINEIVRLEVETIPTSDIIIHTTADVNKIEPGIYEIKSDEEKIHKIIITAQKIGYSTETTELSLDVRDEIDLRIMAEYDGIPLRVEVKQTNSNGTSTVTTPSFKIEKSGLINLSFPNTISQDSNNFEYVKSEINGQVQKSSSYAITAKENTEIKAEYSRLVTVRIVDADVIGPNGMGSKFTSGTAISIIATDKGYVGFLEREVFDRWVGLPSNVDVNSPSITLVVTDSIDGKATYKKDSLMLFVFMGLIGTVGMVGFYGKKKGGINKDLIESIIFDLKNLVKFDMSIINKNKKKKDGNENKNE